MEPQQNLSTRPRYTDPVAEAQYKEAQDSLLSLAETQARADGSNNLPANNESDYRTRFANGVFSAIQQCLDEYALRAQNVSGVMLAKKIEEAAQQKVRLLRAALSEEQTRFNTLLREMERIKPDQAFNLIRFLVAAGLLIIACSEGVLAYPGYRAAALPTYGAIMVAGCVAIGVAIGAPLGAEYIRKASGRSQANIRTALLHAVAFAVFYFLSVLRLHQYNTAALFVTDASEISAPAARADCTTAMAICITSFCLFSLALFACIRFDRPVAAASSRRAFKDKKKKADVLKASITQKESDIAEVESRCEAEQAEALASYEFAVGHQKRLIGLGEQALTLYGATNLRYRSDGLCPEFFTYPPRHAYTSVFVHAMEPAV